MAGCPGVINLHIGSIFEDYLDTISAENISIVYVQAAVYTIMCIYTSNRGTIYRSIYI